MSFSPTFYSILLFLQKGDTPFTHMPCLPSPFLYLQIIWEKMGEQNSFLLGLVWPGDRRLWKFEAESKLEQVVVRKGVNA